MLNRLLFVAAIVVVAYAGTIVGSQPAVSRFIANVLHF